MAKFGRTIRAAGWAALVGFGLILGSQNPFIAEMTLVRIQPTSEQSDTPVVEIGEGRRLSGKTYDQFEAERDHRRPRGYYAGFGCVHRSCSRHDAGFRWAWNNQIKDASSCERSNWSFVEGCRSYLDDQTRSS